MTAVRNLRSRTWCRFSGTVRRVQISEGEVISLRENAQRLSYPATHLSFHAWLRCRRTKFRRNFRRKIRSIFCPRLSAPARSHARPAENSRRAERISAPNRTKNSRPNTAAGRQTGPRSNLPSNFIRESTNFAQNRMHNQTQGQHQIFRRIFSAKFPSVVLNWIPSIFPHERGLGLYIYHFSRDIIIRFSSRAWWTLV